jgi:GrpB-like predicted nucleotidyltransferase (UPF0157 family)
MELTGQLFGQSLNDPVALVPYDPAWAEEFKALRRRLAHALGEAVARIDHVGSTAVPGLVAKPVIDVQVQVVDIDDEPAYRPPLERLGLGLRYREPEWAYFRAAALPRRHHVHVTPAGSPRSRVQLLFVAFLRADPATREAYAALKRELASRFAADRLGYTDAKTGFIRDALERAEAWARTTGWRP